MTQVKLRLVCVLDDLVLIPADTLTSLLRGIAEEAAAWPQQGADAATVGALREMLGRVADQIDVDCIALASELVEVRQGSHGGTRVPTSRPRSPQSGATRKTGGSIMSATIPVPPDPDVVPNPGPVEPPLPVPPHPGPIPQPGPDPEPLPYPDPGPTTPPEPPKEPPEEPQPQPGPDAPGRPY